MDRKDIDQESKKEFSSKVNEQAGRTSKREVFQTKHMTIDQKNSWNEFGYILIPNFVDEKFCDEMNKEVINIIKSIIPEESAFSHAYAGDGHIAIREMKPTEDPKSIEDEISKLFRIHSRGIFNEFINNEVLCDILEDILGPNVDCFLSQFIFKNPGAWGQPWHQDSSYFPFDREPQVGAWLATSEATLENGCLVILPGSHKEHLHEHLPDDRKGSNYGYTEIKDHDFSQETPMTLNTGDLLLFHSFLMHKSYDNNSQARRTAMVYHFAETGTDFGPVDSPTNEWISVRGKGLNA
jgi:ectoine hydroxylase-related dioxygenase (phytanoyl-CoA dioxygenase family)|tara:strand:+ start:3648 stop:4532 length:885 start_codon:yes stop_codon:yes gene_type:complete